MPELHTAPALSRLCGIFFGRLMVFVQIYNHQVCLNIRETLVDGIVFLLLSLCFYLMLILFLNEKLLVLFKVDFG